RPQGLPPRLGASHSPGEDRFPARPSGAARGVEGPLDRSKRLAEAVVRQELPGDGTEELVGDDRGGEGALPRGESGDRRQGPGSVAEDSTRDARRHGEEVAGLAAARVPGEARDDRQAAGVGESPPCVDGDKGPGEERKEVGATAKDRGTVRHYRVATLAAAA